MTYSAGVELPKVHMAAAAPIRRRGESRECGGCSQKLARRSLEESAARCKMQTDGDKRAGRGQIETNAKEI